MRSTARKTSPTLTLTLMVRKNHLFNKTDIKFFCFKLADSDQDNDDSGSLGEEDDSLDEIDDEDEDVDDEEGGKLADLYKSNLDVGSPPGFAFWK
jgi:hypothetical protein